MTSSTTAGWIAAIAAVLLCLVLGYRVYSLDTRLEAIASTVGRPETDDAPEEGSADAPARVGHAERIRALEGQIEDLERSLETISDQAEACAERAQERLDQVMDSESMQKRILNVVEQEEERVLSKQLPWHRDNLMRAREQGLEHLAQAGGLSKGQKRKVRRLMEKEADAMVELVKDPALRKDPEEAAHEVNALLADTDDRIARVLDDQQMRLYRAGRAIERSILMPWLPPPE